MPPPEKPVIWFHASSLGEFEQGLPLIQKWKEKKPGHFILLTFYSPSGYKLKKNYDGVDRVMYLPREITGEVRSFLDHFRPEIAVLIKYEIWPLLIKEMAQRNIPCYLISAVFRQDQLFFKWYGKWYLSILKNFTRIFVQDKKSLQLLNNKGLNNIQIAGDTRIDRVFELTGDNSEIEGIDLFAGDSKIIVAGSSWQKEELFLSRFLSEYPTGGVKVILAPHNISPSHLKEIEDLFGDSLVRYSQFLVEPDKRTDKKVLLIDRIGLLSRLYRYGHIAFIGGAFGAGLHNVLEPAVFNLPVIFGPKYHKFVEAVELVKVKAGFSVYSYPEFRTKLTELLEDSNTLSNAGKGCRLYVENHKGATDLIISHLLEKA